MNSCWLNGLQDLRFFLLGRVSPPCFGSSWRERSSLGSFTLASQWSFAICFELLPQNDHESHSVCLCDTLALALARLFQVTVIVTLRHCARAFPRLEAYVGSLIFCHACVRRPLCASPVLGSSVGLLPSSRWGTQITFLSEWCSLVLVRRLQVS